MGQLNELQIKAAQPRDKEYLLADGEGLYLRVRPTGKAWVYRYKEARKEAKLSLGRYAIPPCQDCDPWRQREMLLDCLRIAAESLDKAPLCRRAVLASGKLLKHASGCINPAEGCARPVGSEEQRRDQS